MLAANAGMDFQGFAQLLVSILQQRLAMMGEVLKFLAVGQEHKEQPQQVLRVRQQQQQQESGSRCMQQHGWKEMDANLQPIPGTPTHAPHANHPTNPQQLPSSVSAPQCSGGHKHEYQQQHEVRKGCGGLDLQHQQKEGGAVDCMPLSERQLIWLLDIQRALWLLLQLLAVVHATAVANGEWHDRHTQQQQQQRKGHERGPWQSLEHQQQRLGRFGDVGDLVDGLSSCGSPPPCVTAFQRVAEVVRTSNRVAMLADDGDDGLAAGLRGLVSGPGVGGGVAEGVPGGVLPLDLLVWLGEGVVSDCLQHLGAGSETSSSPMQGSEAALAGSVTKLPGDEALVQVGGPHLHKYHGCEGCLAVDAVVQGKRDAVGSSLQLLRVGL